MRLSENQKMASVRRPTSNLNFLWAFAQIQGFFKMTFNFKANTMQFQDLEVASSAYIM